MSAVSLTIFGLLPALLSQSEWARFESVDERLRLVGWSGVWQIQVAIAAIALPLLLLTLTMIRDEWMFAIQSRLVLLSQSGILLAGQFAVGGAVVIGLHAVFLNPGVPVATDIVTIVCPTLVLTALSLYRALGLLLDANQLQRRAAEQVCRVLRDSLAETMTTNLARHEAASQMAAVGATYSPFIVDHPGDVRIVAKSATGERLVVRDVDGHQLQVLGQHLAALRSRTGGMAASETPVQIAKNVGDPVSERRDALVVLRVAADDREGQSIASLSRATTKAFIIGSDVGGEPKDTKESMLDQLVAHLVHLIDEGAVAVFEEKLRLYQGVLDALVADTAAYRDAFGEFATKSSHFLPGLHQAEIGWFREDVTDLLDAVISQDRFPFARAFVSFLEGASWDALARDDSESAEYMLLLMVDVYRKWMGAGRTGGDTLAGMINLRLSHAIEFGPLRDKLDSSDPDKLREVGNHLRRLLWVWRRYLLAIFEMEDTTHFAAACKTLDDTLEAAYLETLGHQRAQGEAAPSGGDDEGVTPTAVVERYLRDRSSTFFGVGMTILRHLIEDHLNLQKTTWYLEALPLPRTLRDLSDVFTDTVVMRDEDPLAWERIDEAPFLTPVRVRNLDARTWLVRFWVMQAVAAEDLDTSGRIEPTALSWRFQVARGPSSSKPMTTSRSTSASARREVSMDGGPSSTRRLIRPSNHGESGPRGARARETGR